jgi:hypothetical protein
MVAHTGATLFEACALCALVLHAVAALGLRSTARSCAMLADALVSLPWHFAMSIMDLVCTVGVTVLCMTLAMVMIAQAQPH